MQGAEVVPIWEEMIRGHLLLGALLASADNHKASGSEVLGGFSTERFELQQNDESLSDVSMSQHWPWRQLYGCLWLLTESVLGLEVICHVACTLAWSEATASSRALCSEDSLLGLQVSQECLGMLAPPPTLPFKGFCPLCSSSSEAAWPLTGVVVCIPAMAAGFQHLDGRLQDAGVGPPSQPERTHIPVLLPHLPCACSQEEEHHVGAWCLAQGAWLCTPCALAEDTLTDALAPAHLTSIELA